MSEHHHEMIGIMRKTRATAQPFVGTQWCEYACQAPRIQTPLLD